MHRLKIPGVAVLAAVSLLAAGCGDDEGGALSKEDFTKQGNAICAKYEKESKTLGDPQSVEEIPAYADKALALFDKQLGEMRELEPPEELKSDFNAFIATGDDAKKFITDLKSAAEANDEQAIQKVGEEAETRDKESDDLATKIGLTECAKD